MAIAFAEVSLGAVVGWSLAACALCIAILFVLKPILFVRTAIWILRHTVYRIRVIGQEHFPANGPVLVVCNHVSYLDFLFLLAAQRRYIHFVIFAGWTRVWGLGRMLKWAGVIPIDRGGGPRSIVQSLRQAGDALSRGEVVCIFAEGRFTRTGFLLQFRRGFEQIVKYCPAPIVPACLEQVWGSIFSYWGGKLIWKWPLEIPYPVTVAFGEPMPPTANPTDVRQAVQKLSADCAITRSARSRPAHRQFVRTASRWRQFRKPCIIDSTAARERTFSYGKILAESIHLARALRPKLDAGEALPVGIWLPQGADAALTNITLALLGKPAVNLDDLAPKERILSVIELCRLRHVITSRGFVAQRPFPNTSAVEILYVDDLVGRATRWQRLRTAMAMLLLPNFILDRWVLGLGGHTSSDLLTTIFPRIDGETKGVQLSHRNITANVESLIQVIDASPRDRLLGIFSFSEALGYTVTFWLPLLVGASVVYQDDADDGKATGRICRQHACTILLSRPELLSDYLSECEMGDFASIRLIWCGGKSLPAELCRSFQERFGVSPLLGYGQTELSPVATLNVPDKDLDGFRQIGHQTGTIGQPIPGVAARVVDPVTLEPSPPGQRARLMFYGANVMAGYLDDPAATKRAIRDNWFDTGLAATINDDGFIILQLNDEARSEPAAADASVAETL
jgi:acyl-[acyl-carrier-protein]-phospholipid O-acyltransferase/long-chain-fatty-acid--[acyl-carrier-protein] ligase